MVRLLATEGPVADLVVAVLAAVATSAMKANAKVFIDVDF